METMDSLLSEMLQKFPEVPRDTVIAHVKLYPRNRTALVSELSRVSSTLGATRGGGQNGSRGEELSQMYSDFEPSGLDNAHLESVPMPEPPPSLIITPPQSPEKQKNAPKLCIAKNLGYEAFLLQNQKDRLRALEEAAQKNRECLLKLRDEVTRKERLFFEKSVEVNEDSPNITIETLLELAQANRQLCVQTDSLVTEVDLHTDGRAPLGFYDNIYPGPDNPLATIQESSNRRKEKAVARELPARWSCEHCTFANHPDIRSCEMCLNPRSAASSIASSKFDDSSSDGESSSSDSLSLPDSSGDENANDGIEIQVKKEPRGRSPICLRIRQRAPKDTVTFRFYKNINRD